MRAINAMTNKKWAFLLCGLLLACLILVMFLLPVKEPQDRPAKMAAVPATGESIKEAETAMIVESPSPAGVSKQALSIADEDRIRQMEETLRSIKDTGKAAEERSYQNKIMGLELIKLVRLAVAVLLFMAIALPLTSWYFMGQKRMMAGSTVSDELTATLVAVEERQAKLATILKEIQGEIDYLHSMSVPDLKKLIEQAEKYIAQNEKDLEKARVTGPREKGTAPASQPVVKPS